MAEGCFLWRSNRTAVRRGATYLARGGPEGRKQRIRPARPRPERDAARREMVAIRCESRDSYCGTACVPIRSATWTTGQASVWFRGIDSAATAIGAWGDGPLGAGRESAARDSPAA